MCPGLTLWLPLSLPQVLFPTGLKMYLLSRKWACGLKGCFRLQPRRTLCFHLLCTQELEDYFYYSQLRSQGIDTMETRKVSEHICLSELPFVMRAIGFYPSEEKVGDAKTGDSSGTRYQ